ncbi:MAG: hypothetical protein HC905_31615 [Bacteroidales bacterium]|nr:hypothetical protein [Bacteroidales bacterium]
MRDIKIWIIIGLAFQLISCSSTKNLITLDSDKMVKVNSFDVEGKHLIVGLSYADSLWVNGDFYNSTKEMWNSALLELRGPKVVYNKSDFSKNPNTIRFVDYDREKNILINGFFDSEIDFGLNSKYKSECRTIDYSVKYQNDKSINGLFIIENRNYSRTSGHEISSPTGFWFSIRW